VWRCVVVKERKIGIESGQIVKDTKQAKNARGRMGLL
jgi:hypothetical protein